MIVKQAGVYKCTSEYLEFKGAVSQEHMLIIMRQSHVICKDMQVIIAYVQVTLVLTIHRNGL